MTLQIQEPNRFDEPREAKAYSDVITKVAAEGQAVIVRRDGIDVAAIISLDQWEILQDALAMEEAQRQLKTMDLQRLVKENPPPQSWFDNDEPKPF